MKINRDVKLKGYPYYQIYLTSCVLLKLQTLHEFASLPPCKEVKSNFINIKAYYCYYLFCCCIQCTRYPMYFGGGSWPNK